MKRLISGVVGAFLVLQSAVAFAGGSTVNPAIPAQGAPLASAPIRGNFQAAANDINNILSMFAGTTQPSSPVTYSMWAQTGVNPSPISIWDGTQYVVTGLLDRTAHTYTPALSSVSLIGTSPITVSIAAGVATLACPTCAVLNAANTFTASPQLVQGLTTTQPGWYSQITGDTVSRVRVGLSNTDVASIAFGSGSAVRDTFLERVGPAFLRMGSADSASPIAQTFGVQNVLAGTSNTAGVNLTINGSRGTGTGNGGDIIFQTAPSGSSGSAQNALTNSFIISHLGYPTAATAAVGDNTIRLATDQFVQSAISSNSPFNVKAFPFGAKGDALGPSQGMSDGAITVGTTAFTSTNATFVSTDVGKVIRIQPIQTVTITNASPGVFTWNNHGLIAGTQVIFSTTGALPSPLAVNTVYFVISAGLATNSFRLSTTLGGSAINTTTAGSGTHTARAGTLLDTTIAAATGFHSVTLAANAAGTYSDALFYYGTDDTAAIQAAINAAQTVTTAPTTKPNGSACVYLPAVPFGYITTSSLNITSTACISGDIAFSIGGASSQLLPGLGIDGVVASTFGVYRQSRIAINYFVPALSGSTGIKLLSGSGNNYFANITDSMVWYADRSFSSSTGSAGKLENFKSYYAAIGAVIQSAFVPDSGSIQIINSEFLGQQTTTATSTCAVWNSAGNWHFNKNSCVNTTGVSITLATGATTGQLFLNDNSMDNGAVPGSNGFSFNRAGTTGSLTLVDVSNNICNAIQFCIYAPTDPNGSWINIISGINNKYISAASGVFATIDGADGVFFGGNNLFTTNSAAAYNIGASVINCSRSIDQLSGTFAANTFTSACPTVAVAAASPLVLNAGTGNLTCPTCATTGSGGAISTLTFGAHLISGGSSYNGSTPVTLTSDATSANTASTIVARDGSGNFAAGNITGAAFFGNGANLTSIPVAALTGLGTGVLSALGTNIGSAGAPVLFNGALGTPSSGSIATTLLTGALQAAQEPAHTGDVTNTAGSLALTIAANAVTNAKLATMVTNTVKGNATSGAAVPTDLAMPSCSAASSALAWTTNTGFGCNTSITANAVPAANLTGSTLAAGVTASSLTSLGTIASLSAVVTSFSDTLNVNSNIAGHTNISSFGFAGRLLIDNGGAGTNFYDASTSHNFRSFTSTSWMTITGAGTTLNVLSADTATTDATLCARTSDNLVLKGTGALGICLGTSGAQFKTAFAPMVAGLDEVSKLHLLNYRYREGFGDDGDRMQYGLTAQDVEAVMPDLVRHDASGRAINFDSGALLFIGLRAIQQLKVGNDNFETRLTRLENQK